MFIDIHAHAYRYPVPFVTKFCSPEELLKRFDELQIEKGVLLPIVSPEIYFPQANEDILEMAKNCDRFIPYCNVDPRCLTNSSNAELGKVLEYYKKLGCKGLGEVMPNLPLMHPMVQNLFYYAEKVGLPVVYDGSDQLSGDFGLYDDPGLPQLEHTLQRFPDLVIFGHGPTFWAELGELKTPGERAFVFGFKSGQVGRVPEGKIKEGVVPTLFRRYPNLYGDLSDFTPYCAFRRDIEYAVKFMIEFQDRLFFGTDICSYEMPVEMGEFLIDLRDCGKLPEEVFRKIAKENAKKLLQI